MPLYTYQCEICDEVTDQHNSIANRHDSPYCRCGGETELIIQPTQIQPVLGGGDFPGYMCPVTEKFVTSRKQRREVMKEHDLVERG